MFQAIDLTKTYGTADALKQLNLEVASGEIFCLLGANGAGKSTTIKLFLNLIAPTAGKVLINGIDPQTDRAKTRGLLGYIPEQVVLYSRLSGIENLSYFASLSGESELTKTRLGEALTEAGLPKEAFHRKVSDYSKGMRQKVVIALAILRKSAGLLLDEPTSGLDPQAASDFIRIVRNLSDEGTAILMASHDLYQAHALATRIGVMRRGELVDTVTTAEISHSDLVEWALERMR